MDNENKYWHKPLNEIKKDLIETYYQNEDYEEEDLDNIAFILHFDRGVKYESLVMIKSHTLKGMKDFYNALSKLENTTSNPIDNFSSILFGLIDLHSLDFSFVVENYIVPKQLISARATAVMAIYNMRSKIETFDNRIYDYISNKYNSIKSIDIVTKMLIDGFEPFKNIPDIEKYNTEQLKEIYDGMKSKIDYTKYLNPKLSHQEMNLIRIVLEYNSENDIKKVRSVSGKTSYIITANIYVGD